MCYGEPLIEAWQQTLQATWWLPLVINNSWCACKVNSGNGRMWTDMCCTMTGKDRTVHWGEMARLPTMVNILCWWVRSGYPMSAVVVLAAAAAVWERRGVEAAAAAARHMGWGGSMQAILHYYYITPFLHYTSMWSVVISRPSNTHQWSV